MAASLISDKFRIFNAEQFLSALGDDYYDEEGQFVAQDTDPLNVEERNFMYFFVGRPQAWYAILETYSRQDLNNGGAGDWSLVGEGDLISVASNSFGATVYRVYDDYILLTGITGASNLGTAPALGSALTVTNGAGAGATALSGVYRYADDNATAPTAIDNDKEYYQVWNDMIAAKRMTVSYTRGVVQRFNWKLNGLETFDMYRHDYSESALGGGVTGRPGSAATTIINAPAESLATAKFYVMNGEYQVFKCLYNGSSGAAPDGQNAQYEPALAPANGIYRDPGAGGDGLFIEDLDTSNAALDAAFPGAYYVSPAAGYVWKYMFSLPINDAFRFLSTDFMPIPLESVNSSDRAQTESLAEPGAIYSYYVDNSATTLTAGTYFTEVQGDGTGAILRFASDGSNISNLAVIERGSGYTYGSVIMEDGVAYDGTNVGLYTTYAGGGNAGLSGGVVIPGGVDTAAITAMISPKGGHGAAGAGNIEREFNTKRIMANIRLAYDEGLGDFPVDNDFRRIGIMKDPDSTANQPAIESTLNNLGKIRVSGVADKYKIDEEITQVLSTGGVARARVVSYVDNGGNDYIYYYQDPIEHANYGKIRSFEGNAGVAPANIIGAESGESCPVTNFSGTENNVVWSDGLAFTEFNRNTGDVIYQENRRLITRAIDQIEDIKLVIEF